MKIWILLAIAVLLLVWGIRERFEATQSIKAPPYDDAEKMRIFKMLNGSDEKELIRQVNEQDPTLETTVKTTKAAYDTAVRNKDPAKTSEKLAEERTAAKAAWEAVKDNIPKKAASIISEPVAKFFTDKFKPATVPITNEDVTKYVADLPDPLNKAMIERVLKRYFVGQSGVGSSVKSGYAAALKELGQEAGYLVPNAPGQVPTPAGGAAGATAPATTSIPAAAGVGTAAAGAANAPAGSGGVATTTGTTTGGSSTSSPGPTTGGAGRFGVWGPISGGRGEGGNGPIGNSTTTTQYPELMGGMNAGGDKTRIDGIGLTEPSQNWKLSMSGMLPSAAGLGSGDLSKYLPWSRTPGDMDKIPDPYRVSKTFSTSSYSSKTEPVPFLADFSAFQR